MVKLIPNIYLLLILRNCLDDFIGKNIMKFILIVELFHFNKIFGHRIMKYILNEKSVLKIQFKFDHVYYVADLQLINFP